MSGPNQDEREPRVYISTSPKLSYDFQTAADTIHDEQMRAAFLLQGQKLNSTFPDDRWEAVKAMKMLGRQPLEQVHEFRVASLQVLAEVAAKDPNADVKQMATQTQHILQGVEDEYTASLA